jgi:hypothetical protein
MHGEDEKHPELLSIAGMGEGVPTGFHQSPKDLAIPLLHVYLREIKADFHQRHGQEWF